MKKIICILLGLCLLSGCSMPQTVSKNNESYLIGVWISFTELDSMLLKNFKDEFNTAVGECRSAGVTDMFVHVRPYCDAIYPSKLFPLREGAKSQDFDVLKYMIDVCHQNGINFHAWINPYRVRTADSNIEKLPEGSPAKNWLTDQSKENDINVLIEGGIYLNPASDEVRALVIDGVREIIDNYDVDGIHFDDYFYPTTNSSFDSVSYNEYAAANETPVSLADWRRANVNTLISGTYTAVKFKDKDIIFSVSPSASIEDNFNKHYADVAAWVENDCVDLIIPQLYFGFDYPMNQYKFENLLSDWKTLVSGSNTRLIIGLATYKINTEAEPDKAEWANGTDVIKRQAEICKTDDTVSGHIYFSYSSMKEYL